MTTMRDAVGAAPISPQMISILISGTILNSRITFSTGLSFNNKLLSGKMHFLFSFRAGGEVKKTERQRSKNDSRAGANSKVIFCS